MTVRKAESNRKEVREVIWQQDRVGAVLLGHSKDLDLYCEDGETLEDFEKNKGLN